MGGSPVHKTIEHLIDQLQSIFKDLTAKDIMVTNVIRISPERTLEQAKELMRLKKISGLVVMEKERMVGIVSIEDIIHALEKNRIHEPVARHMTLRVVSLQEDEHLPQIFEKFNRYRFGRFPVLNDEKRLVGIITKEDILRGILEKFRVLYVRDLRRQNVLEGEMTNHSLITGEEINKSGAEFVFPIDYADVTLAGIGAARLKDFLLGKGIPEEIVRKVAIATYEAETNVVIHSSSSGTIYCFPYESYIRVRVEDQGNGIEDVDKAMQEGWTTATDQIREMGFGAGMGIPNMQRYSDKMVIVSESGKGVIVEMQFFL